DETYLYQSGKGHTIQEVRIVKGLNNPDLDAAVGEDLAQQLRDELERMYGEKQENVYYYITTLNENYHMPAMPEGAEEGI
uniref:hypothetical protein n=1 Tax=Bacillus anthracis TaxID=1392 RepID=UPI003904DDAF